MKQSMILTWLFGGASRQDREMRIEQAVRLVQSIPSMALGNMVNSVLTGLLLYGLVNRLLLGAWVALIWVGAVRQLLSWRRNRNRPRPADVPYRVMWRATGWSTLAGLFWGAAAVVVASSGSLSHTVFMAFVIGGQAAAAATWLTPLPPAFLGYAVSSLAPLVVIFLLRGGAAGWVMAAMILSYSGVLAHFALQSYRSFITNLRINLERRQLLADLETAHLELEVRVRERTAELTEANQRLLVEMAERARSDAELRASETKFRTLVEKSIEGIVIHRDDRPLFCNRAFCDLFGYADQEAVLALPSVTAIIAEDERERVPVLFATRAAGAPATGSRAFQGVHTDGRRIWLRVVNSETQWEGAPATQSALVDVSENVVLEEQLRQSQKMEAVGKLAGGVAHDFNNLLQAMLGYTELALSRMGPDQPGRAELEIVSNSGQRGAELTSRLLAFSRQETIRPRNVAVEALVAGQLVLLRRLIGEDIVIVFNSEPGLSVFADPPLLEQTVLNICLNARDAMPGGGVLEITARHVTVDPEFRRLRSWAQAEAYTCIAIRDTGDGIPPEIMGRIFEPFFTNKEIGKGTGLGLAMAYGIVTQHDGMIEVDSTPGKGAEFRVYLPAKTDAPERKAAALAHEEVPGGHETILVAEDDPAIRQLTKEVLENAGYRVLTAGDGIEAFAEVEQHRDALHLLVLDVVMPRMGGRGLYEKLQQLDVRIPVLFSTGYSDSHLDSQFVMDNNLGLIQKPYLPKQLLRAVRAALDAPPRG